MVSKSREVGIRLSVKDDAIVRRALNELGKDGEAALKRIERAGKPASTSLVALNTATRSAREGAGHFFSGMVAGLLPLLTLGAAINGTRAALEKFGDVADRSAESGLDVEFFQGLAHQAKLAGVEFAQFSGSMTVFAKNAGLAAEGKGRMVTQLKALNPELLKNIQLAKTQEERVRLAADAIDATRDAAGKAALATALFGDSGIVMAKAFDGGAEALDRAIGKARELGLIVDRETIAKAEELGDQFDTATQIIDNRFKEALINLAPGLANFASWVAIITGNVRDFVDSFRDIEDLSTTGLDKRLKDLALKDLSLERLQIETQSRLDNPSFLDQINEGALRAELTRIAADRAANQSEQQQVLSEWSNRPKSETPVKPTGGAGDLPTSDDAKRAISEAEALIKRLRTEVEVYADTMTDLQRKLDAGLISQETFNRGQAEAALKFAKAADDADEYAAALQRIEEAHRQGLITEQQYTDAVTDLTKKRLVAQNDWTAGIQLGLLQIKEGARDVATDVASAVTGWADQLGEQIGEAARTGKFAWQDLIRTMLADLAKLATKQLITQPLANLLGTVTGSLFGGGMGGMGGVSNWNIPTSFVPGGFYPGLAEGTDNWRGGPTWVGERGPEILNLPRGSQVIPNHKLGLMGSSVSLSPTYNINGSNLSQGHLLAVLEEHDDLLLRRVSDVVKGDIKNGKWDN